MEIAWQRSYRCDEDSNGCGRTAPMPDGPPDCCPACGNNEFLYGSAQFLPDGKVRNWREWTRFQNPAASYIPFAKNRARHEPRCPWRMSGAQVLLNMLRGEDKKRTVETAEGNKDLVIPYTPGHLGEQAERTKGIIVAMGPGEVTPSGAYMSPEHDFGLYVGAMVMISPSSGNPFGDGLATYRMVQVWDILAVMNPSFGKATWQRLRTQADRDLKTYEADRDHVGFDPIVVPVGPRDIAAEQEQAIEEAREKFGAARKTQVLVSGFKKE